MGEKAWMRVLHVNQSDMIGGAARAAYRIHQAQTENGIDAQLLVHKSFSDEEGIEKIKGGNLEADIRWDIERLINRYHKSQSWNSYNIFPSRMFEYIVKKKPDLVNLHWLGAATLSIKQIGKLPIPVVWTLHDMWAFCGAEHYCNDDRDARFIAGYREKKREKGVGYDLDGWVWKCKQKHWKKPFTIVTPSKWLAQCAQRSMLFGDMRVEVIPYAIDLEKWRPIEKQTARAILNIPQDRKVILFGAIGGMRDERKGGDLLIKALDNFKGELAPSVELVVVGQSKPAQPISSNFPIRYMGHLSDDWSLALVYSSADVFVIPSRMDNLPNTVIESLACGTPCVGFKIGGIPDMVAHKVNGYLATPFCPEDLAQGIEWVLNNGASAELRAEARRKAEILFSPQTVAEKYKELYEQILMEK
jgi:glycosyltransferase involved in cell wall biosynthesis